MRREIDEESGAADMSFKEFLQAMRDGLFTDDDGIAVLYSEESAFRDEEIRLSPSQFGTLRVQWFNK